MTSSAAPSRKALSKIASSRLQKELVEWQVGPPAGFKYKVSDNLQRWVIEVGGAAGTLYAGETYQLQVDFPEHYPMEAPQRVLRRSWRRDPRPSRLWRRQIYMISREDLQTNKMRNLGREEEEGEENKALFLSRCSWLKAKIERDKHYKEPVLAPPVEAQVHPMFEVYEPPTTFHTQRLLHVHKSGSKAVLIAAKSLLGISSSICGKPLKRCSGFWIDWDEENKTGIVLTTAHLIRTNNPINIWLGGEEYAPHANVIVHLLDGTSAEGQLLYYQPHYNLAFVRVRVDQPVRLPSFNEDVKFSQEVFRLGRDNMLDLRITYGRAIHETPDTYERYHYMHFECAHVANNDDEYDNGGPVIDLDGKVVGMYNISSTETFVPSSILVKCVDLWKKYEYIPRIHLAIGMKFEAIKLLEHAHVDKICPMYSIDDGLVVQEVSKGSHAEKFGIQRGDIIECCNGKQISTALELENTLMSICEGSSVSRNDHNAEVHVPIRVFHTLKRQRTTGELTANVSDIGEVIPEDPTLS